MQLIVVGFLDFQQVHIEGDGHFLTDGGEPFALTNLLDILLHLFFECTFQLVGRSQQVLDAAEFLNELLCSFLPYPRTAGNVIDRIAHQSQHIDDLQRRLQSPLLLHFLNAENLCFVALADRRTIHLDAFRNELTEVLVGCHHVGFDALQVCLMREGSDDVISLIALHFEHRNTVCFENILDNWYGKANRFWCFFALSLILREGFMPESTTVRIESHTNMRWLPLCNHLLERIYKTENS